MVCVCVYGVWGDGVEGGVDASKNNYLFDIVFFFCPFLALRPPFIMPMPMLAMLSLCRVVLL